MYPTTCIMTVLPCLQSAEAASVTIPPAVISARQKTAETPSRPYETLLRCSIDRKLYTLGNHVLSFTFCLIALARLSLANASDFLRLNRLIGLCGQIPSHQPGRHSESLTPSHITSAGFVVRSTATVNNTHRQQGWPQNTTRSSAMALSLQPAMSGQ